MPPDPTGVTSGELYTALNEKLLAGLKIRKRALRLASLAQAGRASGRAGERAGRLMTWVRQSIGGRIQEHV
ncbi:MAG: hypothetical protein FD180_1028 [Planctomycetota bacterium]|nr:MAG: hypothetical protein FD180_1028 [Planctomycetota bacterium]